jgi:hypothetical protein
MSETLINFYQTTRRYNPEDSHLHRLLPLQSFLKEICLWESLTIVCFSHWSAESPNSVSSRPSTSVSFVLRGSLIFLSFVMGHVKRIWRFLLPSQVPWNISLSELGFSMLDFKICLSILIRPKATHGMPWHGCSCVSTSNLCKFQ